MVLNVYCALSRRSANAVPCPYVGRAPTTPARRSWAAALMSSICRLSRPDGPAIILTSVGHFHFILRSQNVNSGLWLPPRISIPQDVILGVWEGIFFFFKCNCFFFVKVMQWITAVSSEVKKHLYCDELGKLFHKNGRKKTPLKDLHLLTHYTVVSGSAFLPRLIGKELSGHKNNISPIRHLSLRRRGFDCYPVLTAFTSFLLWARQPFHC